MYRSPTIPFTTEIEPRQSIPLRLVGKVHRSMACAGKVRGQIPKVAKQDKKKKSCGRAHKHI
ncbi:putative ribosomal protein S30 [Helianthus anomalus]